MIGSPMESEQHPHLNPSFIWAQVLATQSMCAALAKGLGVVPEWKRQSTAQIQQLRDLMLSTESPDAALAGLDAALAYLAKVQDPR